MLTISARRPAMPSTRRPPPPMMIGGRGRWAGRGVPVCSVTV